MKLLFLFILFFISTALASSTDSGSAEPAMLDCKNARTTIEMNACISKSVDMAEARLTLYLAKAIERYDDELAIIEALNQSQQDWLVYRKSYCDAIYTLWADGSIRGVMFGECMLEQTDQRTHQIWQDFLTFMDSTPPLLPEPN